MDSLTHMAVGAALAHLTVYQTIGKRALLYGAIIGSLPDIDIIFGSFTDPITAIEIHRGFTHSIFVFLLITPLISGLIKKIEKEKVINYYRINFFVFLTLVTHAILDLLTTWGTQFFWPIPIKIAVQSIFVADPAFTLPIIMGLLISIIKKKLNPNIIGISMAILYLIWGLVIKEYTLSKFENALNAQNIQVVSIQNKPAPLNTILWSANVMTKDGFYIGYYSLFDSQAIKYLYFPKNHQLIPKELANDNNFKKLQKISSNWYTITKENDELFFNDLRFGMIGLDKNSPFVFSYKIHRTTYGYVFTETEKNSKAGKKLLNQLFERIKGN